MKLFLALIFGLVSWPTFLEAGLEEPGLSKPRIKLYKVMVYANNNNPNLTVTWSLMNRTMRNMERLFARLYKKDKFDYVICIARYRWLRFLQGNVTMG